MTKTKEQLARRAASLRKHRKLHPERWKEYRKQDYIKHKDKYIEYERKLRLQKNFGLTIAQYDELFLKKVVYVLFVIYQKQLIIVGAK